MQRKSSPVRHDYSTLVQPAARGNHPLPKHLTWFSVGLGFSLVLAAFAIVLRNEPPPESPPIASEPTISAPDTAPLSETQVSATDGALPVIEPAPLPPQYATLELRIKSGDTLDALFRRNSLSVGDLMTIASLDTAKEPLRMLRPGDELIVTHDNGRIMSMTRNLGIERALEVMRDADGAFVASLVERPVEIRQRIRHGVIETSLFESAIASGISERVIMNVAGIFAWDIDFVYDIRVGDEYLVMYEEKWQDGAKVADGEIVAAEFINRGESFKAIRYVSAEGRTDYFDAEGRSVRKAFLRAPVDFNRISSQFNPNRLHPVLNRVRPHRGVDYAAPIGTEIKAAGDGKIVFRGQQRGYGNVVILEHGGNISTLYAHLNNFRRGQRTGQRVRQGQVIGYLGKTGMVTGAHLHYEYRVNGVHRNPRTVKLPKADPIDPSQREDFERVSTPLLAELERYRSTQLAESTDEPSVRL
ncbi:MAG: peptidoglycan DD-metalloendopeptidase family protein [Pseudomonadota bacterium]